jgi:hypothetical protein
MTNGDNLSVWVLVWFLASVVLVARRWQPGRGVGLVLSYTAAFGATYALAPGLNLLPWNEHRNQMFVATGMRQSALAIVMLLVGVEVANRILDRRRRLAVPAASGPRLVSPILVNAFLIAGMVLHLALFPLARGVPSVSALVATGSTFFVVGIGLRCWYARQLGRDASVAFWVVASLGLPFFTVATQGYLGYGLAAMMTVYTFVASFYRLRPQAALAAGVLLYLGLSVYVTYMRDREDIRDVVWSGSSLDERIDSVRQTLRAAEWFDPWRDDHLRRIDVRLNQAYLMGAAVSHVQSGAVPFAGGDTVVDALLGFVPRAIRPDKPMAAGSGDLVATYTGMSFMGETSVGIGQVMEWYVNFGTTGVLIGSRGRCAARRPRVRPA